MSYRVGIDAGGTFTDLAALGEDHSLLVHKTPSDPVNPAAALIDGLAGLADKAGLALPAFLGQCSTLVHGSTVALNTLLQRNGAKTGLLATAGHEDSLELRLGHKEDGHRWDFHYPPATMIVPARRRLGVKERLIAGGKVHLPLDEAQLDEQLEKLAQAEVEAVAISCLWSFANPAHERKILEKVKQRLPDCYATASVNILPRVGEYTRASTTAANAYIGPVMDRYLSSVETALAENGFAGQLYIMQSNGGVAAPAVVRRRPVAALNSGPAGGPVAALWHAQGLQRKNVIAVDMGGTSFDVSLARNGMPDIVDSVDIARIRIGLPMVNVTSIGAGGGSIARLDERGVLQVGPRSAEARPGPACYMRGGVEPTVTDALVTAGYLPEGALLGGRMKIDPALARQAIKERIADPAGIDVGRAAYGIMEITAKNMVDGIRISSIERGYDPRDYLLVAGGGAGPVFAARLARELGMEQALIPSDAGALCALGEAIAKLRYDAIRACPALLKDLDVARANGLFRAMEEEGKRALGLEGDGGGSVGGGDGDGGDGGVRGSGGIRIERAAEMKYADQIHYCDVQAPLGELDAAKLEELRDNFHRRHKELYTYAEPDNEPEIVSLRASVVIDAVAAPPVGGPGAVASAPGDGPGAVAAPPGGGPGAVAASPGGEPGAVAAPPVGTRSVIMPATGELKTTPVYKGDKLATGATLRGPAIIEEETTTIFVPEGDLLRRHPAGFYLLSINTA